MRVADDLDLECGVARRLRGARALIVEPALRGLAFLTHSLEVFLWTVSSLISSPRWSGGYRFMFMHQENRPTKRRLATRPSRGTSPPSHSTKPKRLSSTDRMGARRPRC